METWELEEVQLWDTLAKVITKQLIFKQNF